MQIIQKTSTGQTISEESLLNRHGRRKEAALMRTEHCRDQKFAVREQYMKSKKAKRERIQQQQDGAHERAVRRREIALRNQAKGLVGKVAKLSLSKLSRKAL